MIFLVGYLAALILAAVHVVVRRGSLDTVERVRVFILYQLAIGWLFGIVAFMGHGLDPAATAQRIGWPPHPQFQFELGSFELGAGLVGPALIIGLLVAYFRLTRSSV